MSRLSLDVKVSLEGIGDGWTAKHFLQFHILTTPKVIELRKKLKAVPEDDEAGSMAVMVDALKVEFIEGQVLVGTDTVPAEVDDIADLPAETISEAFTRIARSKYSDPKAFKS